MKHRNGITLHRIIPPQCRIKKGFQLQHNDVRITSLYGFWYLRLGLLLALKLIHRGCIIAVWFIDSCIQQGIGKTVSKSIILIRLPNIPKMQCHRSRCHGKIQRSPDYKHGNGCHTARLRKIDLLSINRCLFPEYHAEHNHCSSCHSHQDDLPPGQIRCKKRCRIFHQTQI